MSSFFRSLRYKHQVQASSQNELDEHAPDAEESGPADVQGVPIVSSSQVVRVPADPPCFRPCSSGDESPAESGNSEGRTQCRNNSNSNVRPYLIGGTVLIFIVVVIVMLSLVLARTSSGK